MKISFATLLLISLVLTSTLLDIASAQSSPAAPPGFCDPKCGQRCALKGRNSRCFKYCVMCCGRCKCVPSGTSGNKDECPCYRDWKSPNGRPKCP